MPLVSFVMPCHNEQIFIAQAIDSVREQTLEDWELIIVDDYSTDTTRELLEYYRKLDKRVKPILREKHYGVDAARNLGCKITNSDLLLVLDADDWSSNFRARVTYDHFCKHPDTDLFYGSFMASDERGESLILTNARPFTKESLWKTGFFGICHSVIAYPKRIWEKYPYDGGGEWDLFWKLYKDGCKFRYTERVLGAYRCGNHVWEDFEKREKLLAKKRKKMAESLK